jgi:DNA-binding transcriptional ArsR family regulator
VIQPGSHRLGHSRSGVERQFLAKLVGISESAVSHHMRHLRQMGIVNARRNGKEVFYRVEDDHIIALFNQGVNHVKSG